MTGIWKLRLGPAVKRSGRWVLVSKRDNEDNTRATVSQLNRRQLLIPHSDDEWEFAARGVDVWARYRPTP